MELLPEHKRCVEEQQLLQHTGHDQVLPQVLAQELTPLQVQAQELSQAQSLKQQQEPLVEQ